ncbi:hypothetical protein LOAG_11136 [Loa loa]|uniref:Uncharacterized protein n=1 Tax=Loa loa TaxID=7209 RepID=A0A1S0TP28_LOALO|nr:hypothetical protein LOAG_11136 [Loa loa]EFO17364.2 hypothetical protein LOAG_11136 [Loa loa]
MDDVYPCFPIRSQSRPLMVVYMVEDEVLLQDVPVSPLGGYASQCQFATEHNLREAVIL